MAKQTVSGISGVLGELISPPPASTEPAPKKVGPDKIQTPESARTTKPASTRSPSRARVGRPPGTNTRPALPKEKVTLRISSDLIAEYRDWSWDSRCQLSELVERALATYQKSERHS
jgi:uncharacterized protein (DUF4415 family)